MSLVELTVAREEKKTHARRKRPKNHAAGGRERGKVEGGSST
jgi:hypothetical protein